MKIWQFIYYLTILIFLPKKIESGSKKLQQKSFDQIFGERWKERDQTEEANLVDGLRDQKDEIGQSLTDQNNYMDQINEKPTDQHENGDKSGNDQQKREIIRRFRAIKEKVREKGIKCSAKEWVKFEQTIAKKLGTNRKYIYKWIREFGMGSRIDESKKYELVQKCIAMSNEYKQKRKHSRKEWQQNYAEISKKLGVCYNTIQNWKKKFGMNRRETIYTNEEKLEILNRYWNMKQNNPKISDKKIAKTLKINRNTIRIWKCKFEECQKTHTK